MKMRTRKINSDQHMADDGESVTSSNVSTTTEAQDEDAALIAGEFGVNTLDIICSRNSKVHRNPGNQRYYKLIQDFRVKYQTTESRSVKIGLTRQVIQMVQNYGGRFLKWNEGSQSWVELAANAKREKVSHALRIALDPEKRQRSSNTLAPTSAALPQQESKKNDVVSTTGKGRQSSSKAAVAIKAHKKTSKKRESRKSKKESNATTAKAQASTRTFVKTKPIPRVVSSGSQEPGNLSSIEKKPLSKLELRNKMKKELSAPPMGLLQAMSSRRPKDWLNAKTSSSNNNNKRGLPVLPLSSVAGAKSRQQEGDDIVTTGSIPSRSGLANSSQQTSDRTSSSSSSELHLLDWEPIDFESEDSESDIDNLILEPISSQDDPSPIVDLLPIADKSSDVKDDQDDDDSMMMDRIMMEPCPATSAELVAMVQRLSSTNDCH